MAYTILIQGSASKALRKLDKPDRKRVAAAIDALAADPRPPGARTIAVVQPGAYRIRVGDYRVLYEIEDDRLIVLVVKIGHRSSVYKK